MDSRSLSEFLIFLFFAIPILVFVRMLWLYWKQGRDPERDSASVQYEPPDNLTPGECGALLDNVVEVKSITATIVDLSVKGYLAIEPLEAQDDSSVPAPKGGKNYNFHMLKGPGDWNNLKPHERAILSAIFIPINPMLILEKAMSRLEMAAGNTAISEQFSRRVEEMTKATAGARAVLDDSETPRPVVALLDLQTHFYMQLVGIRKLVFDDLAAGGYYQRRPDRVRSLYTAKGVFAGFAMAVAGAFLATKTGTPKLPWILTGVLTGMILAFSGRLLSARTIAGARTAAKVLGFKEFLERVEKDHIERLEKTPELFEKFLPYAMTLGVEKTWTNSFSNVAVQAPQWYQRQHGIGFVPIRLVDDMQGMSDQAGNMATSKPGSPA